MDNGNQLTGGYTYNSNGNMTYKGGDRLTCDAENQLVDYTIPGSYKTVFAYDGRGRLRLRSEYSSAGGTNWTLSVQLTYLYDGMRVLQQRNGTTPMVAYTRGHDLAGSLEGAGGIGGLLARTHGYSAGAWSTHHFYHADGNGNVTYLVNSSQGLGCSYRYRPYGELLSSSTGTLSANANAYRFSSKEWMATSGLYHYGYRFYQPTLQRWPNRDPINELGAKVLANRREAFDRDEEKNLYSFVRNNPVGLYDLFGMKCNGNGVGLNCPFNFSVGKLTVNANCKGVLAIWVIDENNAPAAGATAGTTVSADGYVLNGTTYKIDGSTCVEIDCATSTPTIV